MLMATNFDYLLNENDQYKLFIFEMFQIEQQNTKESLIHVDVLGKKLELSDYKVHQLLNELEHDLRLVSEGGDLSKVRVKKNIVEFEKVNSYVYAQLKLFYFKQSSLGKLLLQVGLFENFSLSEYAEMNFISNGTVYNLRKELNLYLETWDLKLSSKGIVGEETAVRSFFFQLLFFFYSNLENPFPNNINKNKHQFFQELPFQIGFSLSNTQKSLLDFFVTIQRIRVFNDHLLTSEIGVCIKNQEKINRFYKWFSQYFPKLADKYEFHYLLAYLTTYELFDEEDIDVEISQIEKIFYTFVKKKSLDLYNKLSTVERKLRLFFFRLEKLHVNTTTFISDNQFLYFKQCFPKIHEIIFSFTAKLEKIGKRKVNKFERIHAYYELMFCLINQCETYDIETKVYIYVDFSGGDNYNQYISKSIQSFKDLNIHIQDKLNTNTDIYISDFPASSLLCEQIIWKTPPMEYEWGIFSDLVIEIKEKKI
jgi:hypothetical protein